jgi:hypothetical protein
MEEVDHQKDINIDLAVPNDELLDPNEKINFMAYIPVDRKLYKDKEKKKIAEEGEKWYS